MTEFYRDIPKEVREKPVNKIAKEIKKLGYEISNSNGTYLEEPENWGFGILESYGNDILTSISKALSLHCDNYIGKIIGLNESKWVLEVYGRSNIEKLSKIFNDISKNYNANLEVILVTENTKKETLLPTDDI